MKIFKKEMRSYDVSASGLIRGKIYFQFSDLLLAMNKLQGIYSPSKKIKKKKNRWAENQNF